MTVTSEVSNVSNGVSKKSRKPVAKVASTPIRIRTATKLLLEQLLQQANKHRRGRRVKADDLMSYALGLLTEQHIATICEGTLTNKDRLELLFSKVSKEQRGLSRDEFLGMLLAGCLTK